MIEHLINRMRLETANMVGNLASTRIGIVDTFDPNTYTCTVRYQPEDKDNPANSLSQSLPISALSIGNGFGLLTPPNIGDQVVVCFVGNSPQVGYVAGCLFNDVENPPISQSGEFYLIHQMGSFFKITNDGKVSLNGQVEIDITSPVININTTGNVNLNVGGNLNSNITGNAIINSTGAATLSSTSSVSVSAPSVTLSDGTASASGLVKYQEMKDYVESHVHDGISTGTGTSNKPTTSLPSSAQTNIVKGA